MNKEYKLTLVLEDNQLGTTQTITRNMVVSETDYGNRVGIVVEDMIDTYKKLDQMK